MLTPLFLLRSPPKADLGLDPPAEAASTALSVAPLEYAYDHIPAPEPPRRATARHVDVDDASLDGGSGVEHVVDTIVRLLGRIDEDDRPERQNPRIGRDHTTP